MLLIKIYCCFRSYEVVSCPLQVVSGCFLLVVGCFRSFLARCRSFEVVSGHFSSFHVLVSTSKMLYLPKQPLVSTLQKQLFYRALFLTKVVTLQLTKTKSIQKYFSSFMIIAANYLFFVKHFQVYYFGGFNHFQVLKL